MELYDWSQLRPRSGKTCLLATVAIPAGEATEITAELERIDFSYKRQRLIALRIAKQE